MTTVELLASARELVRLGWTRGASARDVSGKQVNLRSKSACKFCMSGALDRASADSIMHGGNEEARLARHHLASATGSEGIARFNDAPGRTLEQVLRTFDAAIRRAERAEQRPASPGPDAPADPAAPE